MEELSAEYQALHEWLFNAYLLGKQSDRSVDMCMLFGPDWRQIEQEMVAEQMAEMIASDPGMKEYCLKKVVERIPIEAGSFA